MKEDKTETRVNLKSSFYFLIIIFAFAFFLFSSHSGFAQISPQDEKSVLEKELAELESKIVQYEKDITITQQQKNTLQNQVSVMKKKIGQLDLQIKKSNLVIQDLGVQIQDTEGSIDKTTLKIEDSKRKLASVLRTLHEEDQRGLVEVLLVEPKLSYFFDNLMTLEALNQRNQEFLNDIKKLKSDLEGQKITLDSEKDDLERVTKLQTLQKQESLQSQKQQEVLLEQTKGKESEYQRILQDAKKRATEIRARIFQLAGVADVQAPTFEQALEVANWAAGVTGIRPAFLLAVLQQESAIGKNVGQCYLKNTVTGAGVSIKTGLVTSRVMSPSRDVQPFLQITKELGRDSFNTQVSCPMSYGWGGAMGPAQFIPSTWIAYRSRVAGVTGSAADPWKIKDSFLAAAFYLGDYGATKQTSSGEWRAAMIYFSGSTSPKYSFYGDSVLRIAKGFEEDIKTIQNSLGFLPK